jgi:carbamoyl-phosphate synthase large subunit
MGWTVQRVAELSGIDPWFLDQVQQLVEFEDELCSYDELADVPRPTLFLAKQMGYSDPQLANLYLGDISTKTILEVRRHRKELGIEPVFKLVDTCAAEFEAITPYYYSTYETPYQIGEAERRGGASRDARDAAGSCGPEGRENEAGGSPTAARSSSSAAAPTASGRASSSTTAAARRPSPAATRTSSP